MKAREIHLELLLGKKVMDIDGRCAGRIEEFVARCRDGKHYVDEVHLGRNALAERLSISTLSLWMLSLLGPTTAGGSHRAAWEQLDLSDPERPKLRCKASDLEKL